MTQYKKVINNQYQVFKFVADTDTEKQYHNEKYILEDKNTFDVILTTFNLAEIKTYLKNNSLSLPRGKWSNQTITC